MKVEAALTSEQRDKFCSVSNPIDVPIFVIFIVGIHLPNPDWTVS